MREKKHGARVVLTLGSFEAGEPQGSTSLGSPFNAKLIG